MSMAVIFPDKGEIFMRDDSLSFYQVLSEELVPALGCTEPIALAFAAAKARDILGSYPDKIRLTSSGSLLKNAKSVVVPHTGGLQGIGASILAGLVGGDVSMSMQLLDGIGKKEINKIRELSERMPIEIYLLKTNSNLHFILEFFRGSEQVFIETKDLHTNIVKIMKNGKIIFQKENDPNLYKGVMTDRSFMTIDSIYDFITKTNWKKLREIMSDQVKDNMAIAKAGLTGEYGVAIGKTILEYDKTILGKMKAYAASALEARMCGCDKPVITNSGSGNQGITASIPVIILAEQLGVSEEQTYRALALSNLLTIYQKTQIGRLSPFCGVVSAGGAAGGAMTYLYNGSKDAIAETINNTLANIAGIICDGAKATCAMKICSAIEAGWLASRLALKRKKYPAGTGIIGRSADDTIISAGKLATEGMASTEEHLMKTILKH